MKEETVKRDGSASDALSRLRALCLALPKALEVEAWGQPTFRVKTMFAMFVVPSDTRRYASVWVKAHPADQELLVQAAPDQFYVPPYVGAKGWVGVVLEGPSTNWDQLADLLQEAWRMSAPKRPVASDLSATRRRS